MSDRIFKQALGIRVGDVVTTSYGSGPFYVWSIHGPVRFRKSMDIVIYPWPVVSLQLVATEDHHLYRRHARGRFFGINDIFRRGDQWFTVGGDEVFIRPPRLGYPELRIDMFLSFPADPEPYRFQDGVDYEKGHRQVWHCERCDLDFNTDEPVRRPPPCIQCGRWASTKVIMATFGRSIYLDEIN